jgi:hypothetical protein
MFHAALVHLSPNFHGFSTYGHTDTHTHTYTHIHTHTHTYTHTYKHIHTHTHIQTHTHTYTHTHIHTHTHILFSLNYPLFRNVAVKMFLPKSFTSSFSVILLLQSASVVNKHIYDIICRRIMFNIFD